MRSHAVSIALCVLLATNGVTGPGEANGQSRSANKLCLFERPARPGAPRVCIRKHSYARDVCRAIQLFAAENSLPPAYFARLIWRESLFRADAISPKGAEGIAQFMPGTAKLRGLEDSFDVVQALAASSLYLSDLRDRFGNLGLAAAAYNAGEGGLGTFLRNGSLPLETRNYVYAITGHPVETWRDEAPAIAAPPLDPAKPFLNACMRLATRRTLRDPVAVHSPDWAPWGVQLAANFDPNVTRRLMSDSMARLPAKLRQERVVMIRQKRVKPGMRPKYQARIGRNSKKDADALCNVIRTSGVACAVVKN